MPIALHTLLLGALAWALTAEASVGALLPDGAWAHGVDDDIQGPLATGGGGFVPALERAGHAGGPRGTAADPSSAPLVVLPPSSYPTARCLDGSPFGVYVRPAPAGATEADRSSFLVVLNGGGLCTHESDCTARAKTQLGTSTVWAPTFDLNTVAFMSYKPGNPFRNWNQVFVPYCTGDMHSGQRTTRSNQTFNLYFSGFENVKATIKFLASNYSLNSTGNTLVWAGGSAGGVGVFSTVDRVAASLPRVRVVGAPVGGFPPDVHWSTINGSAPPAQDVRTPAFRDNNALYDAVLPPRCQAALGPSDSYTCGVPHIAYPYLATPTFIIESETDIVVLCGFEGMPCKPIGKALSNPEVWGEITAYGRNATAMFDATVMKSRRDGFFGASCILHTGFLLDGPIVNGTNAVQALWDWLQDPNPPSAAAHKYLDRCSDDKFFPPCGKHCPLQP